MAMLDDQGRLFGRVNLIDAAVVLFLFALLPLAYGSWVLFRTPLPEIEEVTASVLPGRPGQHIQVRGRNLRPFLRASVGGKAAIFLYESPDRAQVELPPLAPGTYYLAFFDDSRKIVQYPNAVIVPKLVIETITPRELDYGQNPPRIELRGQSFRDSLRVVIGKLEGIYHLVSPDRAEVQLPPLDPGTYDLTLFDGSTEVTRVERAVTIRPEKPVLFRLLVRFVTRPEILQMVQRAQRQPSEPGPPSKVPRPVLESYEVEHDLLGTTKENIIEGRVVILRATVRVVAQWVGDEWQFDGRPVRAGAQFTFTSRTFDLSGMILSLEVVGGRAR